METLTVLAGSGFDGPGAWWPIFPLLWFVLIGGLIFFLIRRGRPQWRNPGYSGESVLAERYARGEISEQEYRERLSVLKTQSR